MRVWLATVVGVFILAGTAHAVDTVSWRGTGDRSLDATLRSLDDQGKRDPEGLITELARRHAIRAEEIRAARDAHDLGPADLFMAAALAKATSRPILEVADQYRENEGKGWGVLAKEMGIKPGSREFHALKRDAQRSLGQAKAMGKAKQKQEREREMGAKGGKPDKAPKGKGRGGH